MWKCFSLFTLILFSSFTHNFKLSHDRISLFDELSVELIVHHPDGYLVDKEKLRMNLLQHIGLIFPPFTLLKEESSPIDRGEKFTFTLKPQLDGEHFISFYDISFLSKNKEDQPVDLLSDIRKVTVFIPNIQKLEENPLTPMPLDNPYPITLEEQIQNPTTLTLTFPSLPFRHFIGLLLIALLALIIKLQPPTKEPESKNPALNAKQKALKNLSTDLKLSGGALYSSLTNTVRVFIEECFDIKATSMTTEEFLKEATKSAVFMGKTEHLLSHFLRTADKVKFAKETPSKQECEEAIATAKEFIEAHVSVA